MLDIYQNITDRIIAELEKGCIPWQCPWRPMDWRHRNLLTQRPYQGINAILLNLKPYKSPFWLTKKQLQKLGGELHDGATGTGIVFWTIYDKDQELSFPVLRYYTVYNLEQTSGIAAKHIPPLPDMDLIPFNPVENAEEVIAGYNNRPQIIHEGNRACYNPSKDLIKMPHRVQFDKGEEYYSTLFHEIVHSTGHSKRLNRPGMTNIRFGSEEYSKEELIAEIGSAFLCAQTGIEAATIRNSTAYIQNWLEHLKKDKKLVVQAAQKAQKAVNYICNYEKNLAAA